MIAFVIRRLLVSIPVLIASTFLTFILVKLSGDPLQFMKLRNPPVPHSTIVTTQHRLGLDGSWVQQYWHWISNVVLHGNFGQAIDATRNIRSDLFSALWVT